MFSESQEIFVKDRVRSRVREKLDQLDPDFDVSCPLSEHEDFERMYAAQQALRVLEPQDRSVLQLSFLEGLTSEEIAGQLGLSDETVRKRKSRAFRKLAEALRSPAQILSRKTGAEV